MREYISKSLRFKILLRDKFKCQYCGASSKEVDRSLQIDHIVPVVRGGKSIASNLITACQPCNIGKGINSLSDPQSLDAVSSALSFLEDQEDYQILADCLSTSTDKSFRKFYGICESIKRGREDANEYYKEKAKRQANEVLQ